jgi:hypothetical protein
MIRKKGTALLDWSENMDCLVLHIDYKKLLLTEKNKRAVLIKLQSLLSVTEKASHAISDSLPDSQEISDCEDSGEDLKIRKLGSHQSPSTIVFKCMSCENPVEINSKQYDECITVDGNYWVCDEGEGGAGGGSSSSAMEAFTGFSFPNPRVKVTKKLVVKSSSSGDV